MSPERAILPITPEPGLTGCSSSSSTTVSPEHVDGRPALHGGVVLGDHGEAVVAALGGADGVGDEDVREVLEELVLDRRREERRRGDHGDQRREVVGGARVVERLDQGLGHGVAGDHQRVDPLPFDQPPHVVGLELGHQDDLGADEALPHDRPLGGAVHERCDGQEGQRRRPGPSPPSPRAPATLVLAMGSDPAAQGVEDVLVPPDHALGHAGGAAGVEDVAVVGRARAEVPLGRAAGHRLLVAARLRAGTGASDPSSITTSVRGGRELGQEGGDVPGESRAGRRAP